MSNQVQADVIGLQNALLNTDNIEQFLREIAVLSTRVVSDGVSCGMTLRHRGRPPVRGACSDPLASAADEVQYQTGDGPCLHAMRHAHRVRIHDVSTHGRWPRFEKRAASLGIRSSLSLPLVADGEPVGALNLYSRTPGAFGDAETTRAEKFAGHASGALTLALRLASCTDLNDQLRSSMISRSVIDQAVGVIMATEHCAQDKAFSLLRTVSQNTNVKLRDLAVTIVTSVSGEPPRPAFFEDG